MRLEAVRMRVIAVTLLTWACGGDGASPRDGGATGTPGHDPDVLVPGPVLSG